MKKLKFIHYWKIFTVILFIFIFSNLIYLSREVIYKSGEPKDDFYSAFLEIDLCYRTNVENDQCNNLGQRMQKLELINKFEFTCNFTDVIACYTKDFRRLPVNEIIEKFEKCNISDWATVKSETENVKKISSDYLLFECQICVKYKFEIQNKETVSKYSIQHSQTNQPFNVYITYSRIYKSDGEYRTKKSLIIRRNCWREEDKSTRCSESENNIIFKIEYFSTKQLEFPFISDCVYRKDQQNSIHLTQNDCYENCIKKEIKFYSLTYNKKDRFKLDYSKKSNLTSLIDKCSALCFRSDCRATGFYKFASYETSIKNKSEKSSIIIELNPNDYRTSAIPLFETSKLIWMCFSLISIFFGINLYDFILKQINLRSFAQRKRRRRKSRKLFKISLIIFTFFLSLSLVLEKILFEFGNRNTNVFRKKESIKERNVSVSVCFDLCKIIKDRFRTRINTCSEEILIKKNLSELNKITWNVTDFKSKASMRNSARQYPIRQDDYEIRFFFRDFKKCFLLYYESKNYWTHLPMQKYSRIHINITKVPFSQFYVEDGYNFPKINNSPNKKSTLHCVNIQTQINSDCIDYKNFNGNPSIISKDDLIQSCVIEKYVNSSKTLPFNANVEIKYNNSKYRLMKFSNDSDLFKNSLKICKKIYEKEECDHVWTYITYKEIFEGNDNITINLTPYIYKTKPIVNENFLIVLNRIYSYLVIFTGFSVRLFVNQIIPNYFLNFLSNFHFRFAKRFVYLFLFLLFSINFFLLFYNIIHHPMLESSFNHFVYEIESNSLRICYEMEIDLNSNKFKLKDLELHTPNISNVLKNILIYGNENEIVANLTFDDFVFDNLTGYRYSNRSDLFFDYIHLKSFYIDNLKCFIFYFSSKKYLKNLHTDYQIFNKLYKVNLKNFTKKKLKKDNIFIFLNSPKQYDFDFNKPFKPSDYFVEMSVLKYKYQDDFWHFKQFFTFLTNSVGLSNPIDNIVSYLANIKKCFMNEQFATTTLIPLRSFEKNDFYIKNREFNFFVQFRTMATNKNEYDFTRNDEKTFFSKSFYEKGSLDSSDELSVTIGESLLKFQEISRNRFRYVELFLHSLVLISFWFKIDVLTLPISLKNAYPIFKYFAICFLYYIVLFLIYLLRLSFSFVRFLQIKKDV